MLEAIEKPRTRVVTLPRFHCQIKIEPDLIDDIDREARRLRASRRRQGAKIDIEDDGTVTISAVDESKAKKARNIIQGMTRKLNEGDVYAGRA